MSCFKTNKTAAAALFSGVMAIPCSVFAQGTADSTMIAASDITTRAVVGRGYAGSSRTRVDRSVVSPFPADRRIIIRPEGLEPVEAQAIAAVPPLAMPAPAGASTTPLAPGEPAVFVDIGALDDAVLRTVPIAPPPASMPQQPAQYLDTGPYSGTMAPAITLLPPVSSFSPD